ncbi:MAG: hypothetical protein KA712_18825 [Myxococcales bacterium]|nr:hypothetical protein [Myxococcales bacterium]
MRIRVQSPSSPKFIAPVPARLGGGRWLLLATGLCLFGGVAFAEAAPPSARGAKAAGKARARKPPPPTAATSEEPGDPPAPAADAEPEAPARPVPPTPSAGVPAPETPAPAPEPGAGARSPVLSAEALRARYDQLRDDVFRARARREVVEKVLFSTKVSLSLTWEANRHYVLEKAEVRLDGTRLWDASLRPVTEAPITLAERPVAPGAHVLSVRLEVRSRDQAALGYVSEQSFALSLPEGKATKVGISVDEEGSLPSYNPDIEIEIEN